MEKNRSQHYLFAFEALPILFHAQTNEFVRYIEKDGIKFLRFWWDHVGDKLEESFRVPWRGLDFEIEPLSAKEKLIWITMPPPGHDQEAYFLALLANPERRFVWVRLPTTRAFALRRWDAVKEPPHTVFGQLTPGALFRKVDDGVEPNMDVFKESVRKMIRRKKK